MTAIFTMVWKSDFLNSADKTTEEGRALEVNFMLRYYEMVWRVGHRNNGMQDCRSRACNLNWLFRCTRWGLRELVMVGVVRVRC